MSIAEDEAERVYPTRYWDGTHVKEKFYCDTDDLQEAYLRGREAPPSDVEVEAVAKRLCWNSCEWDGVDSYAANGEDDGIMPVRFPASMRNISDRPRNYSHWHGGR